IRDWATLRVFARVIAWTTDRWRATALTAAMDCMAPIFWITWACICPAFAAADLLIAEKLPVVSFFMPLVLDLALVRMSSNFVRDSFHSLPTEPPADFWVLEYSPRVWMPQREMTPLTVSKFATILPLDSSSTPSVEATMPPWAAGTDALMPVFTLSTAVLTELLSVSLAPSMALVRPLAALDTQSEPKTQSTIFSPMAMGVNTRPPMRPPMVPMAVPMADLMSSQPPSMRVRNSSKFSLASPALPI